MNCSVCGFDNTPLDPTEEVTHCGGCGTRIAGGDKPFPGTSINPDDDYDPDDPLVVDDAIRENWPDRDLENVVLVKKATFHWGRGIGMEPDGYATDTRVIIRTGHDPCENCGATEREERFAQDGACVARSYSEYCVRCDEQLVEEFHC